MSSDDQVDAQAAHFQEKYAHGSRKLTTSEDPLVRYLTRWRIESAWARLMALAPDIGVHSSVLFLCAGDAGEATTLADLGVQNITITDLSSEGVLAAVQEDSRLKGFACNAMATGLGSGSFDVVIVQDGLHHLPEPVRGFTEMLRISRQAAIFLEGANSRAGRTFGTTWEIEDDAVNYVFRWDRRMVEQVASAYLGPDTFTNASYSFWHHNIKMEKLGVRLGGGAKAARRIEYMKRLIDQVAGHAGNQFCGLIIKSA